MVGYHSYREAGCLALTGSRVPDPPPDLEIRLVPLLVPRPRHLYVPELKFPCHWACLTKHSPVYIFLGCLILGSHVLQKIAGGIVGIVGIGYVVLEFIPSIEPPSNMREADVAGWGAEQV